MPKGSSPKKKKKAGAAADGASAAEPFDQDEAEAAQAAALLAEVMTFKKPLVERVSLNLDALKVSHPNVVLTPANAVSEELKSKASKWEAWTSAAHEPTFSFTYEVEERLLCTKGKAVVTPVDEDGITTVGTTVFSALCPDGTVVAPITISAGDSVIFMQGFACRWEVIEPMEYQWVYTDAVISSGWAHVWCEHEKELSTHRGRMEQLSHRSPA